MAFCKRNNEQSLRFSFFLIIIAMSFTAVNLFSNPPLRPMHIGNMSAATARSRLITSAESYIGTPYRFGGTNSRGMDCSGLIYVSFRDAFNVNIPRTTEHQWGWVERIPVADLQPGDLVFFVTTGNRVSHVGIYTGNGRFIHAQSEGPRTGVMYSRLDEAYWRRTFLGAGRALPWDNEAERSSAGTPREEPRPASTEGVPVSADFGAEAGTIHRSQSWTDTSGYFAGLGLSMAFGGFIDGSVIRGPSVQGRIGYKGLFNQSFQIALELRPQWDRFLGIVRFPVVLIGGTDIIQVFAGPAFTFGNPVIASKNREYEQGFFWLGEAGASFAFPPFEISQGALSFFGEAAWQFYSGKADQSFDFFPDLMSYLRISIGVRYRWFIGSV
jgi:probable lipoprotein NlpC